MIVRPMRAFKIHTLEEAASLLPVLVTPKIDGFRCFKRNGQALTRSGKSIVNEFTRRLIESTIPDGTDGELMIVGGRFSDCQSAFMTRSGMPAVGYRVFDHVEGSLTEPYVARMKRLERMDYPPYVEKLLPQHISTLGQLEEFENRVLAEGHEGVVMRRIYSPYKCNKSTLKEGYLVALKRFEDSEAIIIGFEELMHNANEAFEDELGFTKRSTHHDNQVPMDTLGALIVRDIKTGVEFLIGTGEGLTKELRQTIWRCQDFYIGKIITYKFFPHSIKDRPRHPSFKGFRAAEDL